MGVIIEGQFGQPRPQSQADFIEAYVVNGAAEVLRETGFRQSIIPRLSQLIGRQAMRALAPLDALKSLQTSVNVELTESMTAQEFAEAICAQYQQQIEAHLSKVMLEAEMSAAMAALSTVTLMAHSDQLEG